MNNLELTSKLCSYEILVFNNEQKFLAKFADKFDFEVTRLTLLGVWFGSVNCKFDFMGYTGEHFTDSFRLVDFFDWVGSL